MVLVSSTITAAATFLVSTGIVYGYGIATIINIDNKSSNFLFLPTLLLFISILFVWFISLLRPTFVGGDDDVHTTFIVIVVIMITVLIFVSVRRSFSRSHCGSLCRFESSSFTSSSYFFVVFFSWWWWWRWRSGNFVFLSVATVPFHYSSLYRFIYYYY